jgi:hypothetical protein
MPKGVKAGPNLIINAHDLRIHPSIDVGIFEAFERRRHCL